MKTININRQINKQTMKKLFLLLTLVVSTTMISQTIPLEVKAYKFAEADQKLYDKVWLPANGNITIYDDFVSIVIGDDINDVLTATSESYEDTIDGVKTFSFEAISQYDTETVFVSFLESKIMLIIFQDKSAIAIKYEYLK